MSPVWRSAWSWRLLPPSADETGHTPRRRKHRSTVTSKPRAQRGRHAKAQLSQPDHGEATVWEMDCSIGLTVSCTDRINGGLPLGITLDRAAKA